MIRRCFYASIPQPDVKSALGSKVWGQSRCHGFDGLRTDAWDEFVRPVLEEH